MLAIARHAATLGLGLLLAQDAVAQDAVVQDASAQSAGDRVEQVVAEVEATYKDVKTLQADFVQITRSVAMGDETRQEGTVRLSRPRMMRWDFTGPQASSFVTDGSTMWVYTAADNQVIITEDLGGGSDGAGQLLESLDTLDELFEVSILDGAPAGTVRLELVPKESSAQLKALHLDLAEDGHALQRLLVLDPFDNQTEIRFSAMQTNPGLADSVFTFQIPEGASVVRPDAL